MVVPIHSHVVTRFAPSPTGFLHVGNLRAALYNYAFAKQQNGTFLVRIEDTDLVRSKEEYSQALLKDLQHFGIIPDELIYQSKRFEIYETYLQKLLSSQKAYPCFCTEKELLKDKEEALKKGKPPRYVGRCRILSLEEREAKIQKGEPYCVRLSVQKNQTLHCNDLIYAERSIDSKDVGDFVLRRNNNSFSFLFTNLIDDKELGVTHVFRGSDHLANTLRQAFLSESLGFLSPQYGHLPLIVDEHQKPLSKRDKRSSVQESLSSGMLPLAILNYLWRLGASVQNQEEFYSLESGVAQFNIQKIHKNNARFETQQLLHFQKIALERLSDEAYLDWAKEAPLLKEDDSILSESWRLLWLKERIKLYQDFQEGLLIFNPEGLLSEEAKEVLALENDIFFNLVEDALSLKDDWKSFVQLLQNGLNRKGKSLFMPLRALLTGSVFGASLSSFLTHAPLDLLEARIAVARNFLLKKGIKT